MYCLVYKCIYILKFCVGANSVKESNDIVYNTDDILVGRDQYVKVTTAESISLPPANGVQVSRESCEEAKESVEVGGEG